MPSQFIQSFELKIYKKYIPSCYNLNNKKMTHTVFTDEYAYLTIYNN